jgi:hypothetical protein
MPGAPHPKTSILRDAKNHNTGEFPQKETFFKKMLQRTGTGPANGQSFLSRFSKVFRNF